LRPSGDAASALPNTAWQAEVNKMIHVYKAPVAESDVGAFVDYLTRTESKSSVTPHLSLPKTRFERTDDVGRQGSDAQLCLQRSIERVQGASFPSETCVRTSL
jgi:hypothetical protein